MELTLKSFSQIGQDRFSGRSTFTLDVLNNKTEPFITGNSLQYA